MIRLFRILFPKENICPESSLYYRASAADPRAVEQRDGALAVRDGACVSFDTYFNAFPFCKFREYTGVDSVRVVLKAQGSFSFRLYSLRLSAGNGTARSLLQEKKADCLPDAPVSLLQDFSALPEDGLLYLEAQALSGGAVFYGGSFAAGEAAAQNRVKIAAVVCTYRREEFVYRNMRNVDREIYHSGDGPIRGDIDFFIVDNGHTIDGTEVENEHVRVFRNRNWGGSGGFARGMIEACREPGSYTHVLLMDDDILFETDVLERTAAFLKVLKPEYAEYSLAAGMLEQERPWVQYEAGGVWKGRRGRLLRAGMDLRAPEQILLNERGPEAQYCGWWYMCIPLAVPERFGLPFPFFLKSDDSEYCIRSGSRLIFIGGVGVWHQTFAGKKTPLLEYYLKRNEMILNALHFPRYGLLHNLGKLFLALGKQTVLYHFAGVDYLFAAYRDFLEGADFFLRTDAEKLNRRLAEAGRGKPARPFFHMAAGFFRTAAGMISGYGKAAESYRDRLGELTSFGFWYGRLGIEPVSARPDGKTTDSGSVQSR